LSLKGFFRYYLYRVMKLISLLPDGETVYVFRTDVEKTNYKIPKGNIDLSKMLELSSCNTLLSQLSCFHFLNEINLYKVIHTNRLHVAIAAAMLGKQVYIYSNNYYKVKAIYNFSLKNKFANVYWRD